MGSVGTGVGTNLWERDLGEQGDSLPLSADACRLLLVVALLGPAILRSPPRILPAGSKSFLRLAR